jgi:MOSC domain-containing protein YiiM
MKRAGVVISVNTSPGGIPKRPLEAVEVSHDGLAGDGHNHEKHGPPLQAVSLIDVEDLNDLRAEGYDVGAGATGENVTCRGLDVDSLEVGDRLRFSGGLEIELTKRRKPCYVLDAIHPELKRVIAGRCGYMARVITPATLRPGETIEVVAAAAISA